MDKLNVSFCKADGVEQLWFSLRELGGGRGVGANKPSALLVAAVSHDIRGRRSCLRLVVLILSSLCAPESSFHKDRAYNNGTGPPAHSRPVHREYGGRTAEGRCTSSSPVTLTSLESKTISSYIKFCILILVQGVLSLHEERTMYKIDLFPPEKEHCRTRGQ